MVKTNADRLIKISVMGTVDSPRMPGLPAAPHFIGRDGVPRLAPYIGGIVPNVHVGDPALGWVAENIEPGVAIRSKDAGAHMALKIYACVGNEAVVMSGMAKGAVGTVTGKTGRFADHVIIDFANDVLEKIAIDDKVQVKAQGVGLTIAGKPDIMCKSLSPRLLEAWGVSIEDDCLCVPVATTVPPELMGAGAGLGSEGGSISIQTGDAEMMARHKLNDLRLGDLVAMLDYDSSYGYGYKKGAVSIGVVVHGDSYRPGFGPGVTVLLTAPNGGIEPTLNPNANIAKLLGLR